MPPLPDGHLLGFVLLDLAIILGTARLVGTLFTRFGQPRVVGEIVAGVLIGPTLLGPALWPGFRAPGPLTCPDAPATVPSPGSCLFPAPAQAVLGQLGQVGLLLFSFLTALALDRALLRKRTMGIALVGPGAVLLPILAGVLVGPLLATPVFKPPDAATLGFVLFVGVMLAATALPVMVRILQERDLSRSPLGCTGIAASAVATVGLFVAASVAASLSANPTLEGVLRPLLLAAGYLGLMLLVVRPLLARLAVRIAGRAGPGGDGLPAGPLAAVLLLVFSSGLAAHLAGLTVIVGGFVAGLVLPEATALYRALDGGLGELTRTVLLPIFLAFSGLQTDLTTIPVAAVGGLALLLLGGIVSKWAGGAFLARAAGLSWAEGNVLGILMNCPGVIVLVVALVGLQNGLITAAMQAGIVLVALVTTMMTGPLLTAFLPRLPAASLAPSVPVRTLRP